jgi:hypothetical protein
VPAGVGSDAGGRVAGCRVRQKGAGCRDTHNAKTADGRPPSTHLRCDRDTRDQQRNPAYERRPPDRGPKEGDRSDPSIGRLNPDHQHQTDCASHPSNSRKRNGHARWRGVNEIADERRTEQHEEPRVQEPAPSDRANWHRQGVIHRPPCARLRILWRGGADPERKGARGEMRVDRGHNSPNHGVDRGLQREERDAQAIRAAANGNGWANRDDRPGGIAHDDR